MEFIDKMSEYDFMGPKEGEYKPYQTLNYIEKNIDNIDPVDVENYNMVAGRLYRWLKLALENRKLDIVRRKALIQKERDERDSKIKAKEEREKKRETDLEEAKNKFLEDNKADIEAYENFQKAKDGGGDDYGEETDPEGEAAEKEAPNMPTFEVKEFLENWDVENPDVIIQEDTTDDIDNDWVLNEEENEEQVKNFWSSRTGD